MFSHILLWKKYKTQQQIVKVSRGAYKWTKKLVPPINNPFKTCSLLTLSLASPARYPDTCLHTAFAKIRDKPFNHCHPQYVNIFTLEQLQYTTPDSHTCNEGISRAGMLLSWWVKQLLDPSQELSIQNEAMRIKTDLQYDESSNG